jgi:hypothetical protein
MSRLDKNGDSLNPAYFPARFLRVDSVITCDGPIGDGAFGRNFGKQRALPMRRIRESGI